MQALKGDTRGTLTWLVAGAVAYAEQGLAPPTEVVPFTKQCIESQDLFAQWLRGCENCPVEDGLTAEQLLSRYQQFCIAECEKPKFDSSAAMGRKLKERGYANKRFRDGSRYGLRERLNGDEVDEDINPVSIV